MKALTPKQFDSIIAKKEGKKHQASVGDVREIRKLIFDEIKSNPRALKYLMKELAK